MIGDVPGLAVLEYDAADFAIVRPGQFVLCAVSGERIDLHDLKYWSARWQEAYRGAEEATKAYLRHQGTAGEEGAVTGR
ncbi:DUF2093 domain-containing protein [Sphingobium abikonense]|uniref:DUF2093 domain-containing protein n=1 Tax=Sphingobium abikonense TaxID=86193 RepID=UPI0035169FD7